MDSVQTIRDTAAFRDVSQMTRVQLGLISMVGDLIDLIVDLKKTLAEEQTRLDALEREHDLVAEACQDLQDAVFLSEETK